MPIQYLAAFLLGLVLPLAFAPYEIFPLAVLVPAGLLALWLRNRLSLKHSFWLGFVFGLGLFGAGVSWVFTSIHVFGDVPTSLSLLIMLGLISILSTYPALTGYYLNRYFPVNNSQKILYAFPALWVLSEWIRGWFLTGFTWFFLGYSQTNSPLKGYAPILSVFLVSLAVVMSSALVINAILHYQQKQFRSLYYNLFSLGLIWMTGALLCWIPWTQPQGEPVSIALVQGNIPQSVKWDPENAQLSLDRYMAFTKPLLGKNKIIIWPESAVPMPLQSAKSFINDLDAMAKAKGSTVVLGIPIQATEGGYYNAVVTVGNSEKQVYHKRLLVPFGEYVPLSRYLSHTLQFMHIPMSDMIAGHFRQAPFVIGDIKIMPSICFEITFPELTQINNEPDINMLLVLTNDAWFGKSNAEAQHLQIAAMRALEFRKPILTVTNDGITAVITANGQIIKALPQHEALILQTNVQPYYGITPWLTNGSTPVFVLIVCLLWVARRANKVVAPTRSPDLSKRNSYGRTL